MSNREVLDIFGAPDVIPRRRHGEIFIYHYLRKNNTSLRLTEPVVTRITFFQYSKKEETFDRLVVLFDKDRTVIDYGYTEAAVSAPFYDTCGDLAAPFGGTLDAADQAAFVSLLLQ